VPEEFAGRGALDYFIGSVPITDSSATVAVIES
jgi:hypothetical protein